ncbi:hypothetical protein ABY42_18530 (plasmid) [Haloferax gibbonsii]|uniref:Uncharacterized protein n=1 Tax=Haloferax gibbonsii TaxID=35746 RepID=A0A0K1IZ68_HALGI|nr:hypothetical protein ABY42_18530 [Haloferax gibbonsii]
MSLGGRVFCFEFFRSDWCPVRVDDDFSYCFVSSWIAFCFDKLVFVPLFSQCFFECFHEGVASDVPNCRPKPVVEFGVAVP